jgi:hypothetical protein
MDIQALMDMLGSGSDGRDPLDADEQYGYEQIKLRLKETRELWTAGNDGKDADARLVLSFLDFHEQQIDAAYAAHVKGADNAGASPPIGRLYGDIMESMAKLAQEAREFGCMRARAAGVDLLAKQREYNRAQARLRQEALKRFEQTAYQPDFHGPIVGGGNAA